MDAESTERGSALLARFRSGGFSNLVGDDLQELAEYLDAEAAETERPELLFLSQAIFAVDGLFRERDGYGGIKGGFLIQLDNLAESYFSEAYGDDIDSAKLAREFRDEVTKRVSSYSPSK